MDELLGYIVVIKPETFAVVSGKAGLTLNETANIKDATVVGAQHLVALENHDIEFSAVTPVRLRDECKLYNSAIPADVILDIIDETRQWYI